MREFRLKNHAWLSPPPWAVLLTVVGIFGWLTIPRTNAQDSIRPSSAGSFWGGAANRSQPTKPQAPLFAPRDMDARDPRFRSGASSSFPVPGNPSSDGQTEPLPGEVSQFSGAETPPSIVPGQSESAEAPGPRYLLNDQRGPSNFRLGPADFRLGASVGFVFTDNFANSSTDREGELITTAGIFLNGHWEITKINDLSLTLGIGYTSYLGHPELNSATTTFDLTPGTELAYQMKIGEVSLNFFTRPSLGRDTSQELTLVSGFVYTSFRNDAGVNAFLDLNDVTIQAGYQRSDTIPLTSQTNSVSSADEDQVDATLNSLNRSVNTLSASVTFRLQDDTSAGINASASNVTYQEGAQNNGLSYSAGVFVGRQMTKYISLRAAVGYQLSNFDSGGSNGDTSNSSGLYYTVGMNHRVNRNLSHTLSISSDAELGTTTNTVQTLSVTDQITYIFAKDLTLSANISYQRGEPSGGDFAEPFNLFSVGLSCGYNLTRKLSMGVSYSFTTRTGGNQVSGLQSGNTLVGGGDNDYYQNTIGVSFSYAF